MPAKDAYDKGILSVEFRSELSRLYQSSTALVKVDSIKAALRRLKSDRSGPNILINETQ